VVNIDNNYDQVFVNKTMWIIIEAVLMFAYEMSSWRVWLCIAIALGIIGSLYYKYPELNGIWSVSFPVAIIVIAMGFWWQYRAEKT
jgi:hypothetical protein